VDNLTTLMSAGVVPQDHTLTDADVATIAALTAVEIQALINLKQKLGDDFIQRNGKNIANCFL
jgi:hypothetical protein